MKNFFYNLKNKILYFFLESKKSFFITFFLIILIFIIFLIVEMVLIYNENGYFFKKHQLNDNNSTIFEKKKINLDFQDNGNIIINKNSLVDLNFNDIVFNDKYYEYVYQVIFPDDFSDCFESQKFNIHNDFFDFAYIEKNDDGKSVLNIVENEVFAVKTSFDNDEVSMIFGKPKDMFDKVIVIDPGHGGMDFGVNNGTITEKEVVFEIAKRVEKLFKDSNEIKVYLTRGADEYLKDEERAFFSNQYSDLLISLHVSHYSLYDFANEAKIYWNDNDNGNYEICNEKLAENIKNSISKYLSFQKFDVVKENNAEIKFVDVPAIVFEIGFNSEAIKNSDFFGNIAKGIYDGIIQTLP